MFPFSVQNQGCEYQPTCVDIVDDSAMTGLVKNNMRVHCSLFRDIAIINNVHGEVRMHIPSLR